ncbi:unnamed protein product [Notodromas monacha]|uniref:Uncharacterized protein n=1 Tax=Notodromas monacha TaxID=399045 RepID=A0A7R9BZW0_9CRUS|nr:unnamed protein product [Notodromas monacha]CAG0924829.1 unnamed protein product [Notodromas monacha]
MNSVFVALVLSGVVCAAVADLGYGHHRSYASTPYHADQGYGYHHREPAYGHHAVLTPVHPTYSTGYKQHQHVGYGHHGHHQPVRKKIELVFIDARVADIDHDEHFATEYRSSRQRSKIRYPYYDKYGRGKLLYGYGGPDLYEYTAFKPIDGYYKK